MWKHCVGGIKGSIAKFLAGQTTVYYCSGLQLMNENVCPFWGLDVGTIKSSIANLCHANLEFTIVAWFIIGRLTLITVKLKLLKDFKNTFTLQILASHQQLCCFRIERRVRSLKWKEPPNESFRGQLWKSWSLCTPLSSHEPFSKVTFHSFTCPSCALILTGSSMMSS